MDSPVFILLAMKSFEGFQTGVWTPSDLHFRMIYLIVMCRMDQRDRNTGEEREEIMQLFRQEMLEAWTGEGGRGVGERETNLRASRVLTELDDQQIWQGGGRGKGWW